MANLLFKFSWDHRPFPYNSAQGKRQFMLPFASGIPNLTPDWTQVTGLGNAATGTLTAGSFDKTLGRV
ncbi:phage tail protein, partial [Acinetobacter baumannii]